MLFVHRSRRSRHAFTLIELLTVVVIIGILAGLVTAAAIRVGSTVRKSTHAIELKELEMALQAYKERFGEYPPDFTDAGGYTKEQLFKRHLRNAFPRCPAARINTIWTNYGQSQEPATALAFWLGGVTDASGTPTGFSANPMNPFDNTATSRIGPFYDKFKPERLDSDLRYYPTVEAMTPGGTERAIHYYRAQNGEYYNNYAFRDSRTSGWINPRSMQILSPGMKGGTLTGGNPEFPDGLAEGHLEMMANFTDGTMEDALP